MQPEYLYVDLTKHQDAILTESFKLSQVTVESQALLSDVSEDLLECLKENFFIKMAYLNQGVGLADGEVYVNGKNSGVKTSADGSFVLSALSTGIYKFEIKSKNIYFQEKQVHVDLSSSNCLKTGSALNQRLSGLSSFKAFSFDVCGQIKMIKDQLNSNYLNDFIKSVRISFKKVEQNGPKNYKSTNINENYEYCVQLEANSEYIVHAELSENLSQIIKLMPDEQKIQVTNKPIMNVNFEQMEAKLDGTILLLSRQDVLKDLTLNIKLDDPKRSWNKQVLTQCTKEVVVNQNGETASESIVKCKFSLTNLLFGNYLLTTNYDDLFCWKKQNSININSENQNYLLEQSGYILNYELSHKNSLFKLNDGEQVLFSKNILNDNDLSGKLCLPDARDYKVLIESCHKYTNTESDVDIIPIESSLFVKNSNKIALKALKTQVIIDVLFKFDDPAEKQRVTSDDLFVEVKFGPALQETQLVKFKVKSETSTQTNINQLMFSSKSWFAPNQLIQLNAKSNKILFENNFKELRVDEFNCASNYVQFDAAVGIFLAVSISPADVDEISLVLRSQLDNSVLSQETISAAQGFKLGPLKPPFSSYNVELSKSGYLFNKLNSGVQNKDTVQIDFIAEKLGQLKVNVINSNSKTNLENVLLSLSSENRLFRSTIKTGMNGQASFDNLKPGLYYLIVMMQEYEFIPNSHPIQISDGYYMNLVVEANRIAYSCFGKVSSINGQAESNILVQASGIRSESDSENENELCRSVQESTPVENGLGTFRIYSLRPNCEYMLSLKNSNEQSQKSSKIIPEHYRFIVNSSDVTGRNFVILNQVEKVDVTLSVSFRSSISPVIDLKRVNNYVKVKLFKTNQPNSVLQTQFWPANSMVYFNNLPRESMQQYSIQVELLSPSSVSLFGTITQQQQSVLQQQPVIESVELSFYADSAHKQLVANFDMDKKNYNGFGFDFKQQQYQNFYFTLPLFILMIGLVLNSRRVQQYLQQSYSYVEHKGGFVKYFQALVNPQKANISSVAPAQKSNKSAHKPINRETNQSDSEKQSSPKAKSHRASVIMDDDLIEQAADFDFTIVGRSKKTKKVE
jgi:hypothetical protein